MFMPTAAAVNTNLQLELVVLSTARADKFYITLADHNLLIMVILKTNQTLSISMSLQNTELGQSILKQVYQVEHLRWIHLLLRKEKLLRPVNEVGRISRVKLGLGFETAVLQLLKEKMVNYFTEWRLPVFLNQQP